MGASAAADPSGVEVTAAAPTNSPASPANAAVRAALSGAISTVMGRSGRSIHGSIRFHAMRAVRTHLESDAGSETTTTDPVVLASSGVASHNGLRSPGRAAGMGTTARLYRSWG